ncbi:MAG TPA: phosphodiester glycosidase family protein [Candidatus Sumerlaeota bacterium]|nr:phosphodiester glycosidase family protein [Candidatus Sumerlaeota bacterium]
MKHGTFILAFLFLAALCFAADPWFPGITYGETISLAPGISWRRASDTSVPWQVVIITVDLSRADVDLIPVKWSGASYEKTSVMASRIPGAVAAVNAGYFGGGTSYSHIEIANMVYYTNASSRPARATFGLSADRATLTQSSLNYLNQPVPDNPSWALVTDALGGGPTLVTSGALDVRSVEEGFDAASGVDPDGRQPRTFLGWNISNKTVFLVTVDGRQPGWSIGMTCTEGAKLLLDLGCTHGMNYDGGGSTTAWVAGQVVNRPSDAAGERSVASAWVAAPRIVTPTPTPAPLTIIVDNRDSEFSTVGTWPFSANSGFWNLDSQYHWGGSGQNSATWRPSLPSDGIYEVAAWWVASNNRAFAAPYDVTHRSGATRVLADQTINGAKWNTLGMFEFDAGNAGCVDLTDDCPVDRVVSADAVRFVWLAPLPTPTPAIHPSGFMHY